MSPPTVANFDAELQAKLNMLTHLENERSKSVFCFYKQKITMGESYSLPTFVAIYLTDWITKGQEISEQIFSFSFPPIFFSLLLLQGSKIGQLKINKFLHYIQKRN